MTTKIALNGAKGRMGRAICDAASDGDFEFVSLCDIGDEVGDAFKLADVIIDFSHHSATLGIVEKAVGHLKPVVIGTTGHDSAEREEIIAHSKSIPLVWSGNYSMGMNLLFYFAQKAAEALPELYETEIIEAHHSHKKDAPSGTAMDIARRICEGRNWNLEQVIQHGREGITGERPGKQLGVHAIRGGDVVGDHTVQFFGQGERFELRHQATDRKVFAQGALSSASWVVGKAPGFYEMQDVLGLR